MPTYDKLTTLEMNVWAEGGEIENPSGAKIDTGWEAEEKPPHEYFNWWMNKTADYDGMSLPSVTSVASGRIQSQSMELKVAPYSVFTTKAEGNFAGMIAIDNDKLAFVTLDAGVTIPTKFILRADWDRFLRTVVNYHAGIV